MSAVSISTLALLEHATIVLTQRCYSSLPTHFTASSFAYLQFILHIITRESFSRLWTKLCYSPAWCPSLSFLWPFKALHVLVLLVFPFSTTAILSICHASVTLTILLFPEHPQAYLCLKIPVLATSFAWNALSLSLLSFKWLAVLAFKSKAIYHLLTETILSTPIRIIHCITQPHHPILILYRASIMKIFLI